MTKSLEVAGRRNPLSQPMGSRRAAKKAAAKRHAGRVCFTIANAEEREFDRFFNYMVENREFIRRHPSLAKDFKLMN